MARGCASPRRRDNEEDSSFHGNLSYGPLWWPFASMPRRLRDQRRATRNIISTVLPRRAARSDESVFPRDTGGILQFLVGTKLSTVYYVNIIRISGFSRAEKILRRRSSYFWKCRLVNSFKYWKYIGIWLVDLKCLKFLKQVTIDTRKDFLLLIYVYLEITTINVSKRNLKFGYYFIIVQNSVFLPR